MDSNLVEILKGDKCLYTNDCEFNSSFSGDPEPRNMTPSHGWTPEPEPLSLLSPAITAVYSVVFVVGLIGNCLVMYVIIRYDKPAVHTS